ncbi:lipid-binding SYLF domain-containing protein [Salinisphaera orenii]|nr:lipid-binding SYLF domain-containing protein [Salinisphaera orenii]
MKRWMMALLASAMLLGTTQAAFAATAQENKLDDATTVIRQFVDIPENAIPPALLREAYGIAVIPSVLKVGFVVGGRRGKGVLSVRTQDGSWSNPSFITLTGGSLGWQAGASSSDIILVFKTQRSVDKIANGQFNLGADATVAAGPVGRSVGASTDLGFDAEVYSYSRSRGLFAGVSIEGARLGIDQDANWLFYDEAGIDAYNILRSSDEAGLPEAGERFVYTLDRYMPAAENYRDNAPAGNPGGDVGSRNRSGDASASNRESDEYGGRGQATPYEDGGDGVTVQQGNYDAADNDGNGGARQRSSDGADGGSGYGSSGDGDY